MRELDYFRELNQRPEQQKFLSAISESRGYKNNDILNAFRAIYVPNIVEMESMLGSTSIAKMLYTSEGSTYVPGKLFIPGFSPQGYLITYVAYDAVARYEAKESGNYDKPYYFYPEESSGFRKSNFLLMPYESWEPALKSGRIGIADGVFDGGAVSTAGFPCASNLSSTIGLGAKKILSVFDTVVHFKDNDHAGTELYLSLCKAHKNVELVKIPHLISKDIDGFIKDEGEAKFKTSIDQFGSVNLQKRRLERFK